MISCQKGDLNAPGMETKLEDDLAEKLALMLKYEEFPGLV